ncbi:MAG: demethoxyubiquinone hydroxylase family protein [Rhodospirillales bacterium]|nr:demethoxyubiquinone hydroxylase family protein [Rhodospirillales bacterium]
MSERESEPLRGEQPAGEALARMIRVDHAGEYGAVRIYAGQRAVLGRGAKAALLAHMAEQERQHLEAFSDLLVRRRVRPTVLLPLWNLAGFALGAATAALGERAAMACTVAVEEAIDAHYAAQETALADSEAEVSGLIAHCRTEEREHRDIGLAHGAEQAPGYRLLSAAIKAGCRVAIRLSERI